MSLYTLLSLSCHVTNVQFVALILLHRERIIIHPSRINTVANNILANKYSSYKYPSRFTFIVYVCVYALENSFTLPFIRLVNGRHSKLTETQTASEKRVTYRHSLTQWDARFTRDNSPLLQRHFCNFDKTQFSRGECDTGMRFLVAVHNERL